MQAPARVSLAQLPTPLVRLDRLSRDTSAEIWLKRDDMTGLELSGNKVRKLEYIVARAIAEGCDTLVTEGTWQSNHGRATAIAAARLGMGCRLLIRPEPVGPAQGNLWLERLVGAELRTYPRPHFDHNRESIVATNLDELRQAGRRPCWIPMGASEPLGCWGYIGCAEELGRQLEAARIGACDVVVAISSGGTYAGLVLGRRLHKLQSCDTYAVLVSDDVEHHRSFVMRLCEDAARSYGLPIAAALADLHWIDGYIGRGYAIPYPEVHETIRRVARLEGIVLDPVYTGKAFWGMLEWIRQGRLGVHRPVVFVHTGGIFSDFAWTSEILPSES